MIRYILAVLFVGCFASPVWAEDEPPQEEVQMHVFDDLNANGLSDTAETQDGAQEQYPASSESVEDIALPDTPE